MSTTDIRIDPVEFTSDGITLRGEIYRPHGDGPFPTIVMAGGWCYVKELAQPAYARAFAEAGLLALVFDYRNFGASDGEVRQHIDPWQQIADYRNAISFVETRPDVDPDRIGVWGISYSGGHVLVLGAIDSRVKALTGIVPVIDGFENMRLAHGTVGFRRFNEALLHARRNKHLTGEVTYIQHQPAEEGEVSTWPFPKSKKVFAQLKEREAPRYDGRATAESSELLLAYSVLPYLPRLLGTPTKLVVAEGDDHTHWDLALDAYDRIPGDRKELTLIGKADHLTLYADRDRQASTAADIARFFTDSL